MSQIVVREAQPPDESALLQLYQAVDVYHCEALPGLFRAADDPIAARDIASKLDDPNGILLVAEEEGRVVGLAGARLVEIGLEDPIYQPRRYVYVDDMSVLPDCRGRGVGRALLEAVEAWARERGAEGIELTVFEFNEAARQLYERSGFTTQQRRMTKPI